MAANWRSASASRWASPPGMVRSPRGIVRSREVGRAAPPIQRASAHANSRRHFAQVQRGSWTVRRHQRQGRTAPGRPAEAIALNRRRKLRLPTPALNRRTVHPDVRSHLAAELQRCADAGTYLAIIDTPPRAGSDNAAQAAARVADLVLLPCRPSVLDVEAVADTAARVRAVTAAPVVSNTIRGAA